MPRTQNILSEIVFLQTESVLVVSGVSNGGTNLKPSQLGLIYLWVPGWTCLSYILILIHTEQQLHSFLLVLSDFNHYK